MIKQTLMLLLLSLTMTLATSVTADTLDKKAETSKTKKAKKCQFPKSRKAAPDWVCKAQDDNQIVTAVGSFHKSAAGMEFMEQMAAADARVILAKKLRGSGSQLMTDEQLQGSKVLKKIYGPKGTLYILIGLDRASVQKPQ